jgi:hypothetical protein
MVDHLPCGISDEDGRGLNVPRTECVKQPDTLNGDKQSSGIETKVLFWDPAADPGADVWPPLASRHRPGLVPAAQPALVHDAGGRTGRGHGAAHNTRDCTTAASMLPLHRLSV